MTQQDRVITPSDQESLLAAVARMHERDRALVAAGERRPEDLCALSADFVRRSTVHWTPEATTLFKR